MVVLLPWLLCFALISPSSCGVLRQRQASSPTTTIAQGTYSGSRRTVDNVNVDFYLGVRYAQPPVGNLRFAKPRPVAASSNTYDATTYGSQCLQPNSATGSEDCLFLNIMRPSAASTSGQLPVMVWVHGGGFQTGTANSFDGSRIVATSVAEGAPIIFVAINYRLGAFGFLGGSSMLAAAQAGTATLNAGMYDTRLALQWVQDNIAAFGGDPNRVTLAGQSAGAFIVGNNLLANGGDTQGLFHAAIMESGSPGSANTMRPNHPRLDETFATISRAVGCPDQPNDLSCLKSVSASQLLTAANAVTQSFWNTPQLGLIPYMPVEDFQADGFWFSAAPRYLVNDHKFATVPIISGCNMDEGTRGAPQNLKTSAEFKAWFRKVAVVNTGNPDLVSRTLTRIFELFPDDPVRGAPYRNAATAVSAGTDPNQLYFPPSTNQFKRAASIYGAYRYEAAHRKFIIERYAARAGGVWSYRFAQMDKQVQPYLGVTHSAELPYVFGNTAAISSSGLYEPLSKTIQRAWISFVNYHDPRKLGNLNWPPFTSSGREAIKFKGLDVSVISEWFREESLSYLKSYEAARVLSS